MYDWRLGVPELMEIIAYRVAVLSSADPEWGTSNLRVQQFDSEMNGYRNELIQH